MIINQMVLTLVVEMIAIIIITIIFLEPRREGFVSILKAALLRRKRASTSCLLSRSHGYTAYGRNAKVSTGYMWMKKC